MDVVNLTYFPLSYDSYEREKAKAIVSLCQDV